MLLIGSYKEQCDAEVARERQRLATDARSAEQQRDAVAATAKRDAEQRLSDLQRRYDEERRSTAVRVVFCARTERRIRSVARVGSGTGLALNVVLVMLRGE